MFPIPSDYAHFRVSEDEDMGGRLELRLGLSQALKQQQFLLYYQPQGELATGCINWVEALARWQHPQRGMVLPNQFIPLAEQSEFTALFARWVIDTALRQVTEWQAVGLDWGVAVNLSTRNLMDALLPGEVAQLLEHWGVPGSRLKVEITEQGIMLDMERTLPVLAGLRRLGVRIAIDDFGTGYSSLAYLKRLPVDEVKIDKSFVVDMASDGHAAAIVHATIQLAHSLGLRVVAEGVEDEQTWATLAALGCDAIQGYYLRSPVPPAELALWANTPRPAMVADSLPRGSTALPWGPTGASIQLGGRVPSSGIDVSADGQDQGGQDEDGLEDQGPNDGQGELLHHGAPVCLR